MYSYIEYLKYTFPDFGDGFLSPKEEEKIHLNIFKKSLISEVGNDTSIRYCQLMSQG